MNQPLYSPLRWIASVMLLATAATHIPLVPEHLKEAPYIGMLFMALSTASVALAVLVVLADTPAVWAATGAMTLLAVIAFLTSRTVGLPMIGDEIGNWTEPLALPAVAAESLAFLAAVAVLRPGATPHSHTYVPRKGTS
jgi:hypothetical protein